MDPAPVIGWKPLGEMLVERRLLTAEELDDALEEQEQTGRKLGSILVARRLVSGPALTKILAQQAGVELERQGGFGSGLFALIERRNGRGAPIEEPDEQPSADPQPHLALVETEPPPAPPKPALEAELAALRTELDRERARRVELEQELAGLSARPAKAPAKRTRSKPRTSGS